MVRLRKKLGVRLVVLGMVMGFLESDELMIVGDAVSVFTLVKWGIEI